MKEILNDYMLISLLQDLDWTLSNHTKVRAFDEYGYFHYIFKRGQPEAEWIEYIPNPC